MYIYLLVKRLTIGNCLDEFWIFIQLVSVE